MIYPEVVCWFGLKWYFISYTCWFHIRIYYSIVDGWPHRYYSFPDRSSHRQYWDTCLQCPLQYSEYTGWGRLAVSISWRQADIYICKLHPYTVPVTSSYWKTCPRLSVQYWRHRIPGHYTNNWSWYRLRVPDLGYCSVSYFSYNSSTWIPIPYFTQLSPSTHPLQGIQMVYFRPSPHIFSTLTVNLQVACCNICKDFKW